MIEENGYGVYLYTDDSENRLDAVVVPGNRSMLHVSAPGESDTCPPIRRTVGRDFEVRGLPEVTENTIADREELNDELETIREDRLRARRRGRVKGLQGIGTPILSRETDEVLGAISVYRPADQNIEALVEKGLNPLSQAKNTIEITHTYHG